MKTIQPINIWVNGKTLIGTVLNSYCINDNLSTSATFYFQVLNADLTPLTSGNLIMTGADYTAYESNQYAWDWIATQLGTTITGDYVAPVTENK